MLKIISGNDDTQSHFPVMDQGTVHLLYDMLNLQYVSCISYFLSRKHYILSPYYSNTK